MQSAVSTARLRRSLTGAQSGRSRLAHVCTWRAAGYVDRKSALTASLNTAVILIALPSVAIM